MRVKALTVVTLALGLSVGWGAQGQTEGMLVPDAPQTYQVRAGDTLWSIAGRFLNEPWRWPEVWQANPGVDNPHLIYPGDVLALEMADGVPRVRRVRGGERLASESDGMRVVRLSPRVRTTDLTAAVPTIPLGSIAPFLTRPYVADADQVRRAPYVVGFPDEHLVAGLHDSVYVRRVDTNAVTAFEILRPGDELRDPDTNEVLGYEAIFVADARLERVGDPAKLRLVSTEREVSIGDRVIPASLDMPMEDFFPRPGPPQLRGRILSVLNGVSQIGQFDIVVINRGTRDRIERGFLFEVFTGGDKARDTVRSGGANWAWRNESPLSTDFWFGRDYQFQGWRHNEPSANEPLPPHAGFRRETSTYIRPFEPAGRLMVFRTFDRVSFAIVLDATRAMRVGDQIAPPT